VVEVTAGICILRGINCYKPW